MERTRAALAVAALVAASSAVSASALAGSPAWRAGALLAGAEFAAAGQVDESEGAAGRWWLGPWRNKMRGAPDVEEALGDAGVIKDQRRLDDTSCEAVCEVSLFPRPRASPETVSVPRRRCNPFNDEVTCAAGEYAATHCECETCSAGTYSAEGADECTPCDAGTYAGAAAGSCTSCPAGTYSAAGAGSCVACDAGTYAAVGADKCTPCIAGTYSNPERTQCLSCAAGKFSVEAASACTLCEAGTYAAAGKADECTRCGDEDRYHSRDCSAAGTSMYYLNPSPCTVAGTFPNYEGTGRTLRCIELPNGELFDVLEVEGGTQTCRHTDANSCPAGYDIWVPRSYEQAEAVAGAVASGFTHLVGVYSDKALPAYPNTPTYTMNSGDSGAVAAGWTSVAGAPWFLRDTTYGEPNGDYHTGCWLYSTFNEGQGYTFNDANCGVCFTDYLCSTNNIAYPLHCIELPNGEIVDVLEVEGGTQTCRHTDANSCPVGYDIWVPRSYEHAEAVAGAVASGFTHLVGVYSDKALPAYPNTPTYTMNSGDSGAVAAGWTSVAGAPWFLRDTTYGEPNGDYHTGCWLYSTFNEGQGYTFNDANCGVCFTDYLCSRNSVAGFPWAASLWNPDQSGLTSDYECECALSRDGANCEQEVCASTTATVSLGFLLLEVQWPRHARQLSRNEAFSGISAAFRAFDANSDNRLSVDEARHALRDGGMAVPYEVVHIWSRRQENGVRVEIHEAASSCTESADCSVEGQYCPSSGKCCVGSTWVAAATCRGDVTITDMIQDELARLETQGTKEFYERSMISGAIDPMTATYPNPLTTEDECVDQNEEPPLLEWTIDRGDNVIFQQCAFLNGEALFGGDFLDEDVLNGESNLDSTDCSGSDGDSKCSFGFQLPDTYKVTSPYGRCLSSGTSTYQGRTLHCIELPNGEIVDVLEVEGGTQTCRHTDANSCPVGYDIWVPRSYEHAEAVAGAVASGFMHLVGVYSDKALPAYPNTPTYTMNSGDSGAVAAGWTSVAGAPWFLRDTTYGEPNGDYHTGCWLYSTFNEGQGYTFNDANCGVCFTDYLCSTNNVLAISKQSYCVETKFCPSGTTDCYDSTADPALTVTRCTTGLQYDGTPMDVFPRMLGNEGVSISWLDTSTEATGYRVYKYDASVPFATDTSARLLKEISTSACGLTHNYLDFRDVTTGSEPGLQVGYAIVPLDNAGKEVKDKAGVSGGSSASLSSERRRRLTDTNAGGGGGSGFIVTWWGDILVTVKAEGGGPVEDVTVKLTHLVDDGNGGVMIDDNYKEFLEEQTDAYGEAVLKVRVQDSAWSSLTQHFRVTLEKTSPKADGGVINHQFEPASEDLPLRHLAQPSVEFKDVTSSVISGTVSHAGFDAEWFADDCPHKKSEDTGECMCPVDGVKVMITREGGGVEPVTLNDGKFSTAVVRGETVTLWLEQYTGTSGLAPHSFTVTDDTGGVATTIDGQAPKFAFTADNDAVVDFLDESTVGVSAKLVHGAPQITAAYVNGLPVVARVERCGWQKWDWTLGGEIAFVLGAATEVEVRTLGEDEIDEARYYHPLSGTIGDVDDCSSTQRVDMVASDSTMLRGCRVEIPHGSATASRPCSTNAHTYVDELPEERNVPLDLSNYASSPAGLTVDFVIESPLCVAKVKAAPVTTLTSLVDSSQTRTDFSLQPDGDNENLLLLSELPVPEVVPNNPYGKACTDNPDAVFREDDVVDFTFELVEREPDCSAGGIYPWDHIDHGGSLCTGYGDATPSSATEHEIKIRVADGVSKSSPTYKADVNGRFTHRMEVGKPNPFAPFSHELSVEITRAYDGAEILFVRHVLVLGSIPEEVPQVWTVATNPTLIFSIIRDPPGGASTATLVEGSTISTSMAIDGAHAAQLEDSWQIGTSVGAGVGVKSILGGPGLAVEQNVVTFGGSAGFSYAHTPTDVTVSRSSSRHFDIGITFSTAITTSDSPYLAGQPSDVIVGGGANLRFISSIEIYAEGPSNGGLCVYGRSLLQFLPEQVSTWVMSVYEIEKTIERIGAALADTSTKMENVDASLPEPKDNLAKQIENWQTVLANYRNATGEGQTEGVAKALQQELTEYQDKFREFLAESVKKGNTKFREFLSDGLNEMEKGKLLHDSREHQSSGVPGFDMWEGKAAEKEEVMDRPRLNTFETDTLGRVNAAYMECVASVELPEPGGGARLCDVYQDIYHGINVTSSLLSGICDFKDASASANEFCKRKKYWPGVRDKVIGAFDALHDTEQFVTFSGTTGLEFSWDVAESKGQELSSTHDAAMTDAIGGSLGFGADIGRRRLGTTDKGVPGYAYPTTGKVLAVSKKLLEVTPEALEERRRRLQVTHSAVKKDGTETEPASRDSNPCRRRLDGAKVSGEEHRRLGITACVDFEGGTSSSFSVSLGRAANKESEHEHSIAVSMKDDNIQDVFAVKISQDVIYGTPIFTTMGGRSSCPGETGTTRRDSRVTIKEIKPLCASQEDVDRSAAYNQSLCPSALTCECKDLEPGQDAIFSVVLENLSPWVTSVTYLLRAVNGASTAWDSGKYARVAEEACPPGDLGSLLINPLGSDSGDLRNGEGEIIAPLPYGQFEVRLLVSRRDFAPQCFSYSELELELVSVCEDTDWDGNQDVYQYRTSKPDPNTGDFEVVHPRFVGRPVGSTCSQMDPVITLPDTVEKTPPSGVAHQGNDKGWCYSEVNRAMGCTKTPADCWAKCAWISSSCQSVYVSGTKDSDGTYTARKIFSEVDITCHGSKKFLYECVDCDEDKKRYLRYFDGSQAPGYTSEGEWFIMPDRGCDSFTGGYVASGISDLDDPTLVTNVWWQCECARDENGKCKTGEDNTCDDAGRTVGWEETSSIKVQCAADKDAFELKAVDWEEGTGQCRCQNSCDCLVEDLIDKDGAPFTNTHLLTAADVPYPPADKCDVYSWGVWNDGGEIKPTAARGTDTSRATFDVSWKEGASQNDQLAQLLENQQELFEMVRQMQEENEETAAASGSGLAVGAVFLLAVAAIGYYAYHRYHRQNIAQVEMAQRQQTWGDAAQANYDAIDVETHETNKEDQDTFERNVEVDVELEVQKAPPQPSAYPGGQSLPPWPYPEAKPTARPTPASYDPACILKVSWSRDAARPTEDTLRETFAALAPVLNVGLGSGNAAMVVFKDGAGARAAEAAYDGPWRVAPAKAPAAVDQPPPPPKTGEV